MIWETRVQSQVEAYQRLKKKNSTWCLLAQHYKVWSNPGKGVVPSLDLSVVAIEKGAFSLIY